MRLSFPGRAVLAAAAAMALAAGAVGVAAGQDDAAVEFEPLAVTEPVAPLDASLHLLRLLIEQSAPCLGCDAVLQERPRPIRDLLGYLLVPTPPPPVDEAARIAREIKLKDSPDLEYLRP